MTVPDLGFTLDRTYAATPDQLYAYFTDPELMARWFCPNPEQPTTCDLDVRPGGTSVSYTHLTLPTNREV